MEKKLLPVGLAAGTIAALAPSCAPKQPDRPMPNVIIILTDDVGYGDLSCNGSTTVHTPAVERLASQGIRFTNAHSTSSVSTPARYGLLTGVYPWRVPDTGIAPGDAALIIDTATFTLADLMRSAGYATAAVGKWHLGLGSERGKQDWNGLLSPGPAEIGFDYSYIMAATADRVPCVYIEDGRVVGLDPSDPISVSYSAPFEGEPTGRNNPELLYKLTPSHGHDQAIVNGISRIGYMKGGRAALWRDEDIADRITSAATAFIRRNADRPFFLYFGTNDIHVPRVPNERFVGLTSMGARGDAIMQLDYSVGEVMRVLDSLDIANRTLVILTSDNGPVLDDGYNDDAVRLAGEHRPWGVMRGGKYSAYEAGTRIPMVVRWPERIERGQVSDAAVSQIDFLATMASLTGARIPSGAARDSQDALDAILGHDRKGRAEIVEQNLDGALSIVAGGWKYIAPNDGPAMSNPWVNIELGNDSLPQLYNLKTDISERRNLASEKPELTDRLARRLGRTVRRH